MSRILPTTALAMFGLTLVLSAQQTTQTPSPPTSPQQPGLTFRAAANYVEVDAIVTDERGDQIRGLTCDDFVVSEDGRPQKLNVCSFVDIPIERADPLQHTTRAIEPDVVTNEKPFDGRVFMIVLDGFHVSPLRAASVKKFAKDFVERYLGENDLAAVVQVGNPAAGQEFTSRKRLLDESIGKFSAQAIGSVTDSINRDAQNKDIFQSNGGAGHFIVDPGPPADMDAPMREYMARESIESIRRMAEYMGALGGRRKAVLLFSEGTGIDFGGAAPVDSTKEMFVGPRTDPQSIRLAELGMISAAAKSNVSVYSIDPRGLSAGPDDVTALAITSPAEPVGSPLRDYSNPRIVADGIAEVRRSKELLREFAERTGGLALIDENDMDAAFRRVVADNSAYYLLGYQSPDPRHDGRFHRLEVSVKRPGLRVRSRNGYYAPTTKAEAAPVDPVVGLLRSPAPVGGLNIHASAGVMKGLALKSTVHLTVEFGGQNVPLKNSGGLFVNDIEVEYLALDMKAVSQANVRDIVHLKLKPATKDAFPENGVRYVTEFDLPPGRFQIRVAAREQNGGRTGSVFLDVDVPDFAAQKLALSDPLVTSSSAKRTPTPNNTSTFGTLLKTPTTTARTFTSADTVSAAVFAYDSDTRAPHQVDLKASLKSDAGAEVFSRTEQKDGVLMSAAKGGVSWVVDMPLATLSPGRYVFAIEARSRLSGINPVRKETEITIK